MISALWQSKQGVTSTRIIQELYVNLARKLPKTVSTELAAQIINEPLQFIFDRQKDKLSNKEV